MEKTLLKGGSFSATYRCSNDNGWYIRKEIDSTNNREFGFERWLSQLKILQRYELLFPGIFPTLKDWGVAENGICYMDLEAGWSTRTAFDFLMTNPSEEEVKELLHRIVDTATVMHRRELHSVPGAIILYLREKVFRKMQLCADTSPGMHEHTMQQKVKFNGELVPGFYSVFGKYATALQKLHDELDLPECFVHGNLTLENILYDDVGHILFIDPYEENVIHSQAMDFSQLFQSGRGFYELHMREWGNFDHRGEEFVLPAPVGLHRFFRTITDWGNEQRGESWMDYVSLLEISQFIRMLPFKLLHNLEQAKFFYSYASWRFHGYRESHQ